MPKTPSVIAHRGASGYLPEHTLESKALAYGLGADYIEQDVISSRDGVLIVMHDIYLELVTDVDKKFPERRRADGHYYAIDFDLTELRRLGVMERRHEDEERALFPGRFPRESLKFRISTLEEELLLVQGLNKSTGRVVGIYPEIKDPAWHHEHGIDLSHLLLTMLESFGYTEKDHDAFVQCFDPRELRRVREDLGSKLKLIQLLGGDDAMSKRAMRRIAEYADGVGLPFTKLIDVRGTDSRTLRVAPLCSHIADAGLLVHPYTLRADALPSFTNDFNELLRFLFEDAGVDGIFCDFPDLARRARDAST